MKKLLTLMVAAGLICSMSILSSASAETLKDGTNKGKDKIYEKHYTVNLRNLDIKIEDGNVVITQNKTRELLLDITDENLNNIKEMIKNKNFENDLKKMISEGHTPLAIGVAEAEFEVTKDTNGNDILRPLTEDEVKNNTTNSNISNGAISTLSATGQTQYRDKLSLYTSISGSSPTYWVQSNAYWSSPMSTYYRDAIGVTWDDKLSVNNNSQCTLKCEYGDYTGSLEKIENTAGAAWSFPCGVIYNGGAEYDRLNGVYAGISVTRSGSATTHFFSSEYVHTSQNLSWTAEIGYDSTKATKATLILNPSPTSWKLVSYLSGTF